MASLYLSTCRAPVNIAVIKYWGKEDERLIIPTNDSLSLTLSIDDLCATTTIAASPDFSKDRLWLNGKEESTSTERIQNCLRAIREAAASRSSSPNPEWKLKIISENNFPTAAGLASSAAGYACLVASLKNLYGLEGNYSSVARKGSGSACRSMFGGFVRWHKGIQPDGEDSIAVQVAPSSFWPEIRVIICVVNDVKKDTGSTSGMQRSVETSELLKYRIAEVVPRRIEFMAKAIAEKDFDTFARITMQDSNQFHAICQDTYPPIRYMNQTSWDIVSMVHKYNSKHGSNKLAYTFDAGPNAFLFCLEENVPEIVEVLRTQFPSDSTDFIRGMYSDDIARKTNLSSALACELTPLPPGSLKYVITTRAGEGPTPIQEHLTIE
ncbi:diphosphomevalonate decarboxylase [Galendromus occidentalis]|uniref:Diphosphomevalonate decarboxylase n=1 Tax=Galendromus occidentalis TaxID=34638 RepID=A0AAJ6QTB8_9ACAR|nr:diphosphomevalonate decarboxylase [Galendromus occidentalis]